MDKWLKIIISILFLILFFTIVYPKLSEEASKQIPPDSPWAKTTPLDPLISIISVITAVFIFLRKRDRKSG